MLFRCSSKIPPPKKARVTSIVCTPSAPSTPKNERMRSRNASMTSAHPHKRSLRNLKRSLHRKISGPENFVPGPGTNFSGPLFFVPGPGTIFRPYSLQIYGAHIFLAVLLARPRGGWPAQRSQGFWRLHTRNACRHLHYPTGIYTILHASYTILHHSTLSYTSNCL